MDVRIILTVRGEDRKEVNDALDRILETMEYENVDSDTIAVNLYVDDLPMDNT
jgi:predicted RNA binding protein with dsRBD fold (UPF0201 family)